MRLILHTTAYWPLRAATPKRSARACAEFNTLRLRLIKIAVRVVEGTARIFARSISPFKLAGSLESGSYG